MSKEYDPLLFTKCLCGHIVSIHASCGYYCGSKKCEGKEKLRKIRRACLSYGDPAEMQKLLLEVTDTALNLCAEVETLQSRLSRSVEMEEGY